MSKVTEERKADHIRVNLEEDVDSGLIAGFEHLHFEHNALPEIDLDDIDLSQSFLGKDAGGPPAHFFDDRRHGPGERN